MKTMILLVIVILAANFGVWLGITYYGVGVFYPLTFGESAIIAAILTLVFPLIKGNATFKR